MTAPFERGEVVVLVDADLPGGRSRARVLGILFPSTGSLIYKVLSEAVGPVYCGEEKLEALRRSRWSRLLCALRIHDWRNMDGFCRDCGHRDHLQWWG